MDAAENTRPNEGHRARRSVWLNNSGRFWGVSARLAVEQRGYNDVCDGETSSEKK